MRHAICYVSTSVDSLTEEQIKDLLKFVEEKNKSLGIKGVLLYSEGNFFQILEGEKKTVLDVFNKIEKDARHHSIIKIIGRDISLDSYQTYKVDILNETNREFFDVPLKYKEALIGIPLDLKNTMENMLKRFISTH